MNSLLKVELSLNQAFSCSPWFVVRMHCLRGSSQVAGVWKSSLGDRRALSVAVHLAVPVILASAPLIGTLAVYQTRYVADAMSVARIMAVQTVLVLGAFFCITRRKSTMVASCALGMAAFFVALYPALQGAAIPALSERGAAVLGSVVCAGLLVVGLRMPERVVVGVYKVLAVVSVVFVVFSISVLVGVLRPRTVGAQMESALSALTRPPEVKRSKISAFPDIFHLVLDGMGRPDVLEREFGVAPGYVDKLRSLGFTVSVDRGLSNYAQTHLSMASMLNMQYLDEFGQGQESSRSKVPLLRAMERPAVVAALKQLGYRIEMYATGHPSTGHLSEADLCDCDALWAGELESAIVNNTPFKWLVPRGVDHIPHFRRIVRAFEFLERASGEESQARFVLVHVPAPHPPFVIDENGQFVAVRRLFSGSDGSFFAGTEEEYRVGYRAQAQYLLSRTIRAVSVLLERSRRSGRGAVILIHGDHGPRLGFDGVSPSVTNSDPFKILLAVHWPVGVIAAEEQPQSLVNVYRTLFRTLFEADLPVLPDRSYVSPFVAPFSLREVAVGQ